jgi:hypothetical protein
MGTKAVTTEEYDAAFVATLTRDQKARLEELGRTIIEAIAPGGVAAQKEVDLALAEAARFGVRRDEIEAVLDDGLRVAPLLKVSELQTVAADVAQLRRLLNRRHLSSEALAHLEAAIAIEQSREDEYHALVKRLGIGERRTVLPANLGSLEIGDLRGLGLHRAGFVGDSAVALYGLLADRVPLQRRRKRGLYNEAALQLTARLVSAYFWFVGVKKMTSNDIKSRLQKRQQ